MLDWGGSIVRLFRAGAGENYDFADELQNSRILLCIHASSRPANGNCDRADDAEEAGYCSVGPAAHATSREFLGTAARETPASRAAVAIVQSRPGEGQCRCKAVSGRFPIIRVIVVPTDRGAAMRGCKAGSGSFAVQIRPIAVPTGPGAPMLGRCLDFARLTQFRQVRSLYDQRPRRVGELDFLGRELAENR